MSLSGDKKLKLLKLSIQRLYSTATNPSPSKQNAMNRHSEEGSHIMKKKDSICVSKYV